MSAAPTIIPAPPPSTAIDPRARRWTSAELQLLDAAGLLRGRSAVLVNGAIVDQSHGIPRPARWSLGQYYRLHEMGLFQGERVALIDGVVYQESPMIPPHATAIRAGTRTLEAVSPTGFDVRVQLPLILGQASDPHPDLAVVVGSYLDYAAQHPTTAVLVVEISDTTLAFDRGDKASLYAAGGIADYWVVDLVNRRLEVRRRPVPDPAQAFGYVYADVTTHGPADAVSPLAAPAAVVRVADLLP